VKSGPFTESWRSTMACLMANAAVATRAFDSGSKVHVKPDAQQSRTLASDGRLTVVLSAKALTQRRTRVPCASACYGPRLCDPE
jgi:hypothetical protein